MNEDLPIVVLEYKAIFSPIKRPYIDRGRVRYGQTSANNQIITNPDSLDFIATLITEGWFVIIVKIEDQIEVASVLPPCSNINTFQDNRYNPLLLNIKELATFYSIYFNKKVYQYGAVDITNYTLKKSIFGHNKISEASCAMMKVSDNDYPQFEYIIENMFKKWDIHGAIERTKLKKIIVMLRQEKTMREETNVVLNAMKKRKLITKLSDATGNDLYFMRSGREIIIPKKMDELFGDNYAILLGFKINTGRAGMDGQNVLDKDRDDQELYDRSSHSFLLKHVEPGKIERFV